jgi:hypothetical protein
MFLNWKTTVAGILSGLMALTGPTSGLLAALQAIKGPSADYTLAICGAVTTFIFAVARGWIGLIQNDAPPNPPGVSK